jgi:hypothetical protein
MTDHRRPRKAKLRRGSYVAAVVAALALVTGLAGLLGVGPLDLGTSDSSEATKRQPAVRSAAGELDRLVDDLVDRFSEGDYEQPSARRAERLAAAFESVRAGRLERGARLARPLGYAVVRYLDRTTGRKLVLLVERRTPRRGLGLYVHSPRASSSSIVEVSHPGSDIKSERVGVETFRRVDASELFVAGSLRDAASDDSSDVAHNAHSAFEAVHRTVLERGVLVFQPHGFDSDRRGESYGEIVASSGAAPTKVVRSLASGLRARGFDTCLYQEDRCDALAGTTNVQGRSARAAGASFIHLELARRLREDRALRAKVVSAVAEALG